MAREVGKGEAERFLGKAESFYASAQEDLEKGRFDVAAFNASQAIILANDALCIAFLGKRPSKDHREAIQLHVQASAGKENKKEVISDALKMRGEFGYTEVKASEKEASLLLVKARRFIDWIMDRTV
jgi:HEPN domain-containing protein